MNGTGSPDVSMLMERCRSGDMSAFRHIVEIHQHYAYTIAFRVLRDEESAKDVVQEAFIRVWKHIAMYQTTVKFTTWLYKIVVHLCYDRMKMESRRRKIVGLFGAMTQNEDLADGRNPVDAYETRDIAEHLLALAKRLPPRQQLVFMLRDVQDFTIAEIAEITEMSAGSVKTNLCYARQRIRAAYEGLERRGER